MKKHFIRGTYGYVGVVIGTVIVELLFRGKIEHFLNKLKIFIIGYVLYLVIILIIVSIVSNKH